MLSPLANLLNLSTVSINLFLNNIHDLGAYGLFYSLSNLTNLSNLTLLLDSNELSKQIWHLFKHYFYKIEYILVDQWKIISVFFFYYFHMIIVIVDAFIFDAIHQSSITNSTLLYWWESTTKISNYNIFYLEKSKQIIFNLLFFILFLEFNERSLFIFSFSNMWYSFVQFNWV